MNFGMKQTITTVVLAMVSVLILTSVVIPMVMESKDAVKGDDFDIGAVFTYTPTTNYDDAEFSFSGSAMDYLTVSEDGRTVSGTFSVSGEYELIITASTTQPTQTATQTFTFTVGVKGNEQASALIVVIPTLLIVGLIVGIVRSYSGSGNGAFSEGSGIGVGGGSLPSLGTSGNLGGGGVLSNIWDSISGLWSGFGKR